MSIHQHTILENRSKAKRGHGWIKRTYKKMSFRLCECGNPVKSPQRTCQECRDREAEARRWKVCNVCGDAFRLEDHQSGSVKVCPRCKDAHWKMAHETVLLYFSPENPFDYLPEEERIRKFASVQRNIIQAVTDYPEFKLRHIHFESVPRSSLTFDHINAMTYLIENYIRQVREDYKMAEYEAFKEYLLKYSVQFRVTPEQNMTLAKYQATGITPEKYIEVVGPIKGMSIKKSIEKIRPHFING